MQWGKPIAARRSFFAQLMADPNQPSVKRAIEIQGEKRHLTVYRVPLDMPYYRLLNGRTASLQEEWLAEHPEKGSDFFSTDNDGREAQDIQHSLLTKLIEEKDLLSFFKDGKNKQNDEVILDENGFIINGNRRVCAWRTLFEKDSEKYKHFEYIDVVILPAVDTKTIDRLEAQLQVLKDIKADYKWNNLALMIKKRRDLHKLSIDDLSALYDVDASHYLDMLDYAERYLESIGKKGYWRLVEDKKYAFEKLVEKRKKIEKTGEKLFFEAAAFSMITDPTGGRLYEAIPDLFEHREKVKAKLLADIITDVPTATSDGLFPTEKHESESIYLAKAITEYPNQEKLVECIRDVIEAEKAIKKDKHSELFLLNQLSKANSLIMAAKNCMKKDMQTVGVRDVITSIYDILEDIEKWLDENAKH